jgi:hypothetical protein
MPDDPARPFGRDILKLRALFVPAGAADRASMADVTRAFGHGVVKVSAIFVPEGAAPPGSAYMHPVRAVFRPDEDDGVRQTPREGVGRGRRSQHTGKARLSCHRPPR